MKLTSTLILFFMSIFLSSCSDDKNIYDKQGTSSGGGGFAQSGTSQLLDFAKNHLADSIAIMPNSFFSEFPEEYNKLAISQIIRDLKFLPTERRQRNGQYLKLDYDKNKKSLIATYDFYVIYNVSSVESLFFPEDKVTKVVYEIQQDILHELSHLLGIGVTATTDSTSRFFAISILQSIRELIYSCKSKDYNLSFSPYGKLLEIEPSSNTGAIIESNDMEDKVSLWDDFNEYLSGEFLTNDTSNHPLASFHDYLLSDLGYSSFKMKLKDGTLTFDVESTDYEVYETYNYESKEWEIEKRNYLLKMTSALNFDEKFQNAKLTTQRKFFNLDSNLKKYNETPYNEEVFVLDFSECTVIETFEPSLKIYPLNTILNNQITSYRDPKLKSLQQAIGN